jgi:hypothetical protein
VPPAAGQGSEASKELIRRSRDWLQANAPVVIDEPLQDPIELESAGDFAEPEYELESTIGRPQPAPEAPPRRRPAGPRPAPTSPTPAPLPTSTPGPVSTGGGRGSRMGLLIGAAVLGVAILANVVGVLSGSEDDETPGPAVTEPVTTLFEPALEESSVRSFGSLSEYTNPCNGEEIAGDVEAVIVFQETGDAADPGSRVSVSITGTDLAGSLGNTYQMALAAETEAAGVLTTYSFDTDSIVWTWGDGLTFTEEASMTVSVIDGQADNWTFAVNESTCGQ